MPREKPSATQSSANCINGCERMKQKVTFDPGLTQTYTRSLSRTIRDDGSFNIQRYGGNIRDFNLYLLLVHMSWPKFFAFVLAVFFAVNLLFAGGYAAIGIQHLKGAEAASFGERFLNAFFFSTHTLTTVGYGSIYPVGPAANLLAALEALVGLLGFAVVTGILFGRFSRPSVRIGYSERMLIAPYGDGSSLQFRVVNRRTNNLVEVGARVLLMTVEQNGGQMRRKFTPLDLERDQVFFLALTWTVVHPITETSPLYGKTAEDLKNLQAELLILVKGFDESFGQTVNSRRSYTFDEIVWNARFTQAFDVDARGELRLEVNRVSSYEPAAPAKAD